MSLIDWVPAALLLTAATYSVFLYIVYRGTAAFSNQRMGQAVSCNWAAKLYVAALRRPATTIAFYLCAYEIPLGVFIVTGVAISQEAASLMAPYWGFFLILALSSFISAVATPRIVGDTRTDSEEAAYWSDMEGRREETRSARS